MGFLLKWDRIIKTTDKAIQIPAGVLEEMEKQEHVWSLHPQCPKSCQTIFIFMAGKRMKSGWKGEAHGACKGNSPGLY